VTQRPAGSDADALRDVIRAFDSAKSRDEVFATAWAAVRTRMECETMMVSSFDPQEGKIRCIYLNSTQKVVSPSALPPRPLDPQGQGTQSLVIRSGTALLFEDFRTQFRTSQPRYVVDYAGRLRTLGPQPADEDMQVPPCAIMVPFGLGGARTGVLQVFSTHPDAYTVAELVFLDVLGEAVSSAIARIDAH
jgi:hypothetical protein